MHKFKRVFCLGLTLIILVVSGQTYARNAIESLWARAALPEYNAAESAGVQESTAADVLDAGIIMAQALAFTPLKITDEIIIDGPIIYDEKAAETVIEETAEEIITEFEEELPEDEEPGGAIAVAAVEYTIIRDFGFEREYISFRDRNKIKSQDMRQKSELSEEVLREYLSRFPNLLGIAPTLVQVQEEYPVNAILLLAIIRLESGNGRSNLAVSKNNIGGIKAPSSSVAAFRSFDSKEDCVIFMARLLANHYLTEGGRFFSGFTIVDIGRRYASSRYWGTQVRNLMFEIQSGIDRISDRLAEG